MSKSSIDDLFDTPGQKANSSGSTKSPSGTKKQQKRPDASSTSGKKAEATSSPDSSTRAASSSGKQSGAGADGWERFLEPRLEEPMTMALHEAAMKVEELSNTSWADMTKLQRVEFQTAMTVLREERERAYNAEHPERAEKQAEWLRKNDRHAEADKMEEQLGRKKATTTEVILRREGIRPTGGQSKESSPSPTDKLGAATRIPPGQIPKDQQRPNRRIDFLAEVEATGRGLTALLLDDKYSTNDKLSLASLRNKRIKDIPISERTEEQNRELEQAQKLLTGPTRPPGWETPAREPLPTSARNLKAVPPPPKKEALDIDALFVDTDSLFDDDEAEAAPAPKKRTVTEEILDESFGPEPEGYDAWRALRIKMDAISEKKDKQKFRAKHETFDPYREDFLPRYRFEKEVINDRLEKKADLTHPDTRAELVRVGKQVNDVAQNGPLTAAEAADGGQRKPKGQPDLKGKQRSAAGQGEKAPTSIAVAGTDDGPDADYVTALTAVKMSDEITEDTWAQAQDEAIMQEESAPRELEYSPTYRAILEVVRRHLKYGGELVIVYEPEALLWAYPRILDMAEQTIPRRNEIVGRVLTFWKKHAFEPDGTTPKPGIAVRARHYRVILAAKALGDCIENYATAWRQTGPRKTDEELANQCKAAVVRYLEAHREPGYPEPSYLEYREIIAKQGHKEGYLLTPEDLAKV